MKKKTVPATKIPATKTHDQFVIERLRKDPEMAAELLKVAIEEIEEEGGEYVFRRVLRDIAKAQGIGKIAKKAGIPPESLSRALSPRGNPRFSTLFAVLKAMDMQLTLRT